MRVVITDCDHGYFDPETEIFKQRGIDYAVHRCVTDDEIASAAAGADGILCQRIQITEQTMERLPRLRVIGRYGSGVDSIDLMAAARRKIRVVYTPYFCYEDVADATMGLILALSRSIVRINHAIKTETEKFCKEYNERLKYYTNVNRPATQTLGIIGTGKVGRAVARRARSFGYHLIGYDPYVTRDLMQLHEIEKLDTFGSLLTQSDLVTIHAPLTCETRRMLDAEAFKRMKPTAYLVNTARGGIIDEQALAEALQGGDIAGAALDVLEEEPIRFSHPFLTMDNVILTPHQAFYSNQSIQDLKGCIATYVVNALTNEGDFEEVTIDRSQRWLPAKG